MLDQENVAYFKSLSAVLSHPDLENQDTLIDNLYNEINGKEIQLSLHAETSRIIEKILEKSTEFQLCVFFDRLTGSVLKLITHRCGSHVLQKLVDLCGKYVDSKLSGTSDGLRNASQLIHDMLLELKPNMITVAHDQFGSFVLRSFLSTFSSSDSMKPLLHSLAAPFINEKPSNLQQFCCHKYCSPYLQVLLSHLSQECVPDYESLINKMCFKLYSDPNSSELSKFFMKISKDTVGSRLAEAIVVTLNADKLCWLYENVLHKSIVDIASNASANFIIQKCFHVCNVLLFDQMVDDMELYKDCLLKNRFGLFCKALEACRRLGVSAEKLLKILFQILKVSDPKNIVTLLVYLKPSDTSSTGSTIQSQGIEVLQHLFKLSGSNVVVDSLLNTSADLLVELATHRNGSHVIEAFMNGPASVSAKRKLVRILLSSMLKLFTNKSGSFVADSCFKVSDINLKKSIVECIANNEARLRNDFYGRIILKNLRYEEYKKNQELWIQREESSLKKKEIFKEFIELNAPDTKDEIDTIFTEKKKTKREGADSKRSSKKSRKEKHEKKVKSE